jgi:hypothetical protein
MIDMKRLFSILPMLVLAFNLLNAADLRTIFINMPDSVMPLFTKSERMDFFDYMDSGMDAKATNKLGGESVMTLFRDDMLSINTSESGRADIVLFKRKDGTSLICMIVTVLGNYPDSRLSFYNEDWTPVPANSLIKYPSMEDYLTKKALKIRCFIMLTIKGILIRFIIHYKSKSGVISRQLPIKLNLIP